MTSWPPSPAKRAPPPSSESASARAIRLRRALLTVPRERFVDVEHVGHCAADNALPLSEDGGSTLSAMHAYVAAFDALDLRRGDQLVDLGGGTGYGAALASEIVGAEGRVLSLELESDLVARAPSLLAAYPQTRLVVADAHQTEHWRGASKVYVAFAIPDLPPNWTDALTDGAKLVAPLLTAGGEQKLTLFEKRGGALHRIELGPVHYVPDRTRARSRAPLPVRQLHLRGPTGGEQPPVPFSLSSNRAAPRWSDERKRR